MVAPRRGAKARYLALVALVPCLSCLQTDLIPLPDWLLPRVGVCSDIVYLLELPVIMSAQSFVDLDGDGTQELIASGEEYLAISTLAADDGYYASQIWTFVGASMGAPAAGDVNGDGASDVLVPIRVGSETSLWWTLQGDDGGFSEPSRVDLEIDDTIVTGDLNGDGRHDVLWVDGNAGTLNWVLAADDAQGQPSFNAVVVGPVVCDSAAQPSDCDNISLLVAQLDADPEPELLVGDANPGADALSRIDFEAGSVLETSTVATAQGLAARALLADVDGDGIDDLITWFAAPNQRTDEIAVLLADAPGSYGAPSVLEVGDTDLVREVTLRKVVATDVDGDGTLDLWLDGQWIEGDGQGGFEFVGHIDHGDAFIEAVSAARGPCSFESFAVGDWNQDGRTDVAGCDWLVDGVYTSTYASYGFVGGGWWTYVTYVDYDPYPALASGCAE